MNAEDIREVLRRHPKIRTVARRMMSLVPRAVLLGTGFWHWYAFYGESEAWSREEMTAYQFGKLRALLTEISRTSAFYGERLRDVDVAGIETVEGFAARVETLSRREFGQEFARIRCARDKGERIGRSQTSGTTGMALQFYHPLADDAREWAAICHQWKRVGYVPQVSRRAEFRGLVGEGTLVEANPQRGMIRCSILDLKTEHVRHYADEIRKHNVDYYHGYPSALYLLAREIRRAGVKFPQPKGVLLSSEMVFEWQLDELQSAFPNAQLFAHYGCAERTVLAGWCEHRREYHVLPQYALVERDPVTSEIIGTNLYNCVNGFVRYRMTDTVGRFETAVCPDCRRPYVPRLGDLGGRSEDYLYSEQHGWIPPAIVTYPLKGLKVIREMQFMQAGKAEVTVRYAVADLTDPADFADELGRIREGLTRLLGSGTRLEFTRVDGFERGATGKFKWIVCTLDETPGGSRD